MSTKIYTGFKMEAESFEEAAKKIDSFQKKLAPIVQEKLGKMLLRWATQKIDEACMAGEAIPEKAFSSVFSEYLDRGAERSAAKMRNPGMDFGVSMTLFPFEGRVYGMLFAEDRDLESLWKKEPGVLDFAYWNNSDPDETVSEEEWDERARVWEEIFKTESIPARAGFSRDCAEETPMLDPDFLRENFERLLPAWSERVEGIAKEIFLQNKVKGENQETLTVSKILRLANDKSPEANLEREVIRLAVEKKLPREISKKMLGIYCPEQEDLPEERRAPSAAPKMRK